MILNIIIIIISISIGIAWIRVRPSASSAPDRQPIDQPHRKEVNLTGIVQSIKTVKHVLRELWPFLPFWLWVFVMSTLVLLAGLGTSGDRSYDYLSLGSLLWLGGHFLVTCWHGISAAWTNVQLKAHGSRATRVRHCLAEAWRGSKAEHRLIAFYEIAFCVCWLVVFPLPFT